MNRDMIRERCWLGEAEHTAGAQGFAAAVRDRLELGELLYGDRWAGLSILELVDELLEECADIGAWGVLALQALDHVDSAGIARDELAGLLARAARGGAHAFAALTHARTRLQGGSR